MTRTVLRLSTTIALAASAAFIAPTAAPRNGLRDQPGKPAPHPG